MKPLLSWLASWFRRRPSPTPAERVCVELRWIPGLADLLFVTVLRGDRGIRFVAPLSRRRSVCPWQSVN